MTPSASNFTTYKPMKLLNLVAQSTSSLVAQSRDPNSSQTPMMKITSSATSPLDFSQSKNTTTPLIAIVKMVTSTLSVTIMTSMMARSSTLQTVTHLNLCNGNSVDPFLPPF